MADLPLGRTRRAARSGPLRQFPGRSTGDPHARMMSEVMLLAGDLGLACLMRPAQEEAQHRDADHRQNREDRRHRG